MDPKFTPPAWGPSRSHQRFSIEPVSEGPSKENYYGGTGTHLVEITPVPECNEIIIIIIIADVRRHSHLGNRGISDILPTWGQ